MSQLYKNNAVGALLNSINNTDTLMQLEFSQGALFPFIESGVDVDDYFLATLVGLTAGEETSWEIVRVVSKFGDLFGIERGEEGTTAQSWDAGTKVALRLTAGQVAGFEATKEWGNHAGLYLPVGGGSLSGPINSPSYRETVVNMADTASVNLNNGNVFHTAPSGNKTYTFDNPPASGIAVSFTLEVTPSAAMTITWPAGVIWPEGEAPSSPASGDTSIFTFYTRDGGTTWYGFIAGEAMA